MKRTVLLVLIVIALGMNGLAQKASLAPDLQSLVDAERAFARTASEKGVRDSFLAFIADDGILYRPGPVNGKKWLTDRPARPGLLTWEPVYADISAAGDMGFTTGPWEFRPNGPDDVPIGYGQFASVWKKQANGTWKFVNDIGIDHGRHKFPAVPWKLPEKYNVAKTEKKVDVAKRKKDLLALDEKLSKALLKQRIGFPLADYSAENIRLLRSGSHPFIGGNMVIVFENLFSGRRPLSCKPLDADVSVSGDLGYTYGSYELKAGNKLPAEAGNYLRVWKKQKNGIWKVVLDVMSVIPK